MMTDLLQAIADALLPRLCQACTARLNRQERTLCTSCLTKLPYRRHIKAETSQGITDSPIAGNIAVLLNYSHGSMINKLATKFKFGGNRQIAYDLGRLAGSIMARQGIFDGVELIIPVPLSPEKLRKRKYNQAMEVARGMADVTNLPVADAMQRAAGGQSQKDKRQEERETDENAGFILTLPDQCKGKHVAIADDIMTTGATLMQCAQALEGCAAKATLVAVAATNRI